MTPRFQIRSYQTYVCPRMNDAHTGQDLVLCTSSERETTRLVNKDLQTRFATMQSIRAWIHTITPKVEFVFTPGNLPHCWLTSPASSSRQFSPPIASITMLLTSLMLFFLQKSMKKGGMTKSR